MSYVKVSVFTGALKHKQKNNSCAVTDKSLLLFLETIDEVLHELRIDISGSDVDDTASIIRKKIRTFEEMIPRAVFQLALRENECLTIPKKQEQEKIRSKMDTIPHQSDRFSS